MDDGQVENAFVRARHSRVEASREELAGLVHRAVSSPPVVMERIVRGYDNEVYRVRAESGTEIVIRIGRFGGDRPGFEAEAWAMERARDAGLPVPEVLLLDRIGDGADSDAPAMVLELVPGRPLADVPATDPRREHALAEAGELLARLHTVTVGGFWRFDQDGRWTARDWATVAEGALRDRRSELPLIGSTGFSNADLAEISDLLAVGLMDYPCEQPVLCHGDYTPEHIFVDERLRVTGVIDFGEFHGGAAIGDLAYLRFALPSAEFEAILAGYPTVDERSPAIRRQLDLGALTLAIGHLAHELTIGDREEAAVSARTLAGLLDGIRA